MAHFTRQCIFAPLGLGNFSPSICSRETFCVSSQSAAACFTFAVRDKAYVCVWRETSSGWTDRSYLRLQLFGICAAPLHVYMWNARRTRDLIYCGAAKRKKRVFDAAAAHFLSLTLRLPWRNLVSCFTRRFRTCHVINPRSTFFFFESKLYLKWIPRRSPREREREFFGWLEDICWLDLSLVTGIERMRQNPFLDWR